MSLPSDRFLVGPKETVSISNIRALAATKSERAGWMLGSDRIKITSRRDGAQPIAGV